MNNNIFEQTEPLMLISELQKKLSEIKNRYGDLSVWVCQDQDEYNEGRNFQDHELVSLDVDHYIIRSDKMRLEIR